MGREITGMLGAASRVRLVPFDNAQVVPGIAPDTYFLIVQGQVPCFNMEVRLVPRIYVRCPGYWIIEVVGTLIGDVCLDTTRPYVEWTSLDGITGCKGIEVVGENRSQQFEVSGGCACDDG